MDHRIPKVGTAISVLLAIGALFTFLFLNNKFEGPDPTAFLRNPSQLTAKFEDTKTLPTKQAVLYKGISVGRVNKVTYDRAERMGVVTFTLDSGFDLHSDAVMQIGYRSLLGDPFLDVLNRGSDSEPVLESGAEVTRTKPTVDFDEALAFLDQRGRNHVRSLIKTVADGTVRPGNGERLNGTLGGTTRTIDELHTLTRTLHGQEDQIAGLVAGASTVLKEIGSREQSVREIVAAGRTTLDALASNTSSLDQAMVELPRLLDSGTRSLAAVRPLLSEARPLTTKLRRLAPNLTAALEPANPNSLGEITHNLVAVIDALPALSRRAVPVLKRANDLLVELAPLVKAIAPAARNLVPALSYLTPRVEAIAGLYALVAATTKGRDSVGNYLRAGFNLDPAEGLDDPVAANCDPATQNDAPNQGYCFNPYPGPGDATDPQPFRGDFPRIHPCKAPPRSTPKAPCK